MCGVQYQGMDCCVFLVDLFIAAIREEVRMHGQGAWDGCRYVGCAIIQVFHILQDCAVVVCCPIDNDDIPKCIANHPRLRATPKQVIRIIQPIPARM